VAVVTSLCYYRGRKKNRWISGWISRETEDVLKPTDTNYTNFGGVIGYNFVYAMRKPFREAKGTFTLMPRHSLFFLPISLLITRHDKYYLQLYVEGKLAGEGHIVTRSYLAKARRVITGVENFEQEEADCQGRRFVLLYKGKGMDAKLRQFLFNLEHPELLIHFCCYAENSNFFLFAKPARLKLGELLKSYVPGLKPFFIKGGFSDESGNAEEN
jgi:hypothetical protein